MANAVSWFEVMGKDGAKARQFYADAFGWTFDVPEEMDYGMTPEGSDGIRGGVGSNPMGQTYATFYVDVEDVQAALDKVESLGASKVVGPMEVPNGPTIGMFTDPDGNLVGVYKRM